VEAHCYRGKRGHRGTTEGEKQRWCVRFRTGDQGKLVGKRSTADGSNFEKEEYGGKGGPRAHESGGTRSFERENHLGDPFRNCPKTAEGPFGWGGRKGVGGKKTRDLGKKVNHFKPENGEFTQKVVPFGGNISIVSRGEGPPQEKGEKLTKP